jgi:hypothetical protein
MSLFRVYVALCVIGTVLPYMALGIFVAEYGLDLPLAADMLTTNPISVFAWVDVVVSAVAVIVAATVAGRRGLRGWYWPIAGTLTVGVSLGLPLLLALQERHGTSPRT